MNELLGLIIAIQTGMLSVIFVSNTVFKEWSMMMNRWILLVWMIFISGFVVVLKISPGLVESHVVKQLLMFFYVSLFMRVLGQCVEGRFKGLDLKRISFGVWILGVLMSLFFWVIPLNGFSLWPECLVLSMMNISVGWLSMNYEVLRRENQFASVGNGTGHVSFYVQNAVARSRGTGFMTASLQTPLGKAMHGFLISILGSSLFSVLAGIKVKGWIEVCVVLSMMGFLSILGALGACLGPKFRKG